MRLALAQINPTIGDIDANADLIIARIGEARDAAADLVVFPELSLCGYPPRDLLLHEGFVPACVAAAKRIGEQHTAGITAIFGLPLPAGEEATPVNLGNWTGTGRIANALLVYRHNAFVEYYDKRLLPTYDVFDEDRYFTPGNRAVVVECGGDRTRTGLSICEDLWRGEDAGFASHYITAPDPVLELQGLGAELLISPSASPFVLGKGQRHRDILRRYAKAGMYVAAVNQVGGNDDLIFDGHAAVFAPDGTLLAAAPGFEEHLLVVDLNPGSCGPGACPLEVPTDPLVCAPAEELLFKALTLGTRDYLHKTGFKTAVLGISGGIDSAVVAALAVAAIGPHNLTGLILPSKYSSQHSRDDARDLAQRLGIRALEIPIDAPFEGFRSAIDPAFAELGLARLGAQLPDICEENVQSRVRGTLLMTWSNRSGAMVLTTGNKSELAVGYATLYGDMNGGLAPISDITKQQIYSLARWMNANFAACGFAAPPIPQRSIDKVPSAELRPNQTDQDSLPPYDVLDEVIQRYVERKEHPTRIIRESGIDATTVHRIVRLIDIAEYKRKQAAVGLKVTSVAFGSGRRVPIAQRWRPR
jgi:NAD+ synthase (glutamine-hydrolysing)